MSGDETLALIFCLVLALVLWGRWLWEALAVAPHGLLVPELMPQQINTPVGNPSFWWLALLHAPTE